MACISFLPGLLRGSRFFAAYPRLWKKQMWVSFNYRYVVAGQRFFRKKCCKIYLGMVLLNRDV